MNKILLNEKNKQYFLTYLRESLSGWKSEFKCFKSEDEMIKVIEDMRPHVKRGLYKDLKVECKVNYEIVNYEIN